MSFIVLSISFIIVCEFNHRKDYLLFPEHQFLTKSIVTRLNTALNKVKTHKHCWLQYNLIIPRKSRFIIYDSSGFDTCNGLVSDASETRAVCLYQARTTIICVIIRNCSPKLIKLYGCKQTTVQLFTSKGNYKIPFEFFLIGRFHHKSVINVSHCKQILIAPEN